MNKMSIWKIIGYTGLVLIICIVVFLIVKYIVRDSINWEKPPIDVSERL